MADELTDDERRALFKVVRQSAPRALLDRIRQQVEAEDGDSREHSFILAERIRLASEALPDGEKQTFTRALHQVAWEGRRELSQAEAVALIARPVYIMDGHKPYKPKAKKTRLQFSGELRRGVFQKLVRLPANRSKAKATRRKAGDESRKTVFPLIREAIMNGIPRRGIRAEVKRLAASRKITIVGEWQLGRIITEFFKVDTTT